MTATTSDTLLDAVEAWNDDPVRPTSDDPTPAEVVAHLSRNDRALRVRHLTQRAHEIADEALEAHLDGRRLVATCALYSGGDDSTTLLHLFRRRVTHAIHANTGIGVERTREFVRETCKEWGVPLIEKHPPTSYRDLVVERGFPGPAMHFKMYQRLKERCLAAARRDLVTNPREERVLFLAGRRRSESRRRATIPVHERRDSIVWASPLVAWTKLDLGTYRELHDVPRNPVSAVLHMSGECLCGAFAKPGELDEIGYWFPEVREHIEALEAEVAAAGHPASLCRWGHGSGGKPSKSGPLCSSCDLLVDDLANIEFVSAGVA